MLGQLGASGFYGWNCAISLMRITVLMRCYWADPRHRANEGLGAQRSGYGVGHRKPTQAVADGWSSWVTSGRWLAACA